VFYCLASTALSVLSYLCVLLPTVVVVATVAVLSVHVSAAASCLLPSTSVLLSACCYCKCHKHCCCYAYALYSHHCVCVCAYLCMHSAMIACVMCDGVYVCVVRSLMYSVRLVTVLCMHHCYFCMLCMRFYAWYKQ